VGQATTDAVLRLVVYTETKLNDLKRSNDNGRQVSRLLGIGSDKLVLLDSKTKLLLKSYPASELHGWTPSDVGGRGPRRRRHRHALTLEFRGTTKSPWTVAAPSADAFRSVAAALWDMIGVGNQPSDNTVQRPFNADLLDFSTTLSLLFNSYRYPCLFLSVGMNFCAEGYHTV